MAFRPVSVPANPGPINDIPVPLGKSTSPPADYNTGADGQFLAAPFPQSHSAPVYWLAKYTVTQAQYAAVSGHCPNGTPSDMPVTKVSWYDAVAFTQNFTAWLLKNNPTALPARGTATGFVRLPTEVEWEYAARGGVNVPASVYFADSWAPTAQMRDYAVAGEDFSSGAPSPIGSRKPNPLGLYDMLGNVGQWSLDLYHFTRLGRASGLTGGFVVRGGSYATPFTNLSSAGRQEVLPFDPATGIATRLSNVGFRVVIGVATGNDAARAADISQALTAFAKARISPAAAPLAALPGLEADTADPVLRTGLQDMGMALARANAGTLREEIAAAASLTLAIYKIQKDTDLLQYMFTSPALAGLRTPAANAAGMKHLAADRDGLERLVDAYGELLQTIVAAAPHDEIDSSIAAEQTAMQSQADPQLAFMPLLKQSLDRMSQGAFLNGDDLLAGIKSVK